MEITQRTNEHPSGLFSFVSLLPRLIFFCGS